jgi:hypothetical protein
MNWLLIFVPVAIGLEFLAPERYLLVFVTSALATLPLAGWMGRATEQLAERMGEGVGGLHAFWLDLKGHKSKGFGGNRFWACIRPTSGGASKVAACHSS